MRLVDFTGDEWKVLAETVVYGGEFRGQTHAGQAMSDMFKSIKFGQPSLLKLPSGEFLASHWCIEEGQGRVRSHRLRLTL